MEIKEDNEGEKKKKKKRKKRSLGREWGSNNEGRKVVEMVLAWQAIAGNHTASKPKVSLSSFLSLLFYFVFKKKKKIIDYYLGKNQVPQALSYHL